MSIEFFFDCSSPWTVSAFENLQPLAAEFGVPIVWRPILVGGIFNAVNPGVEYKKRLATDPPRKMIYYLKDLQDWARAATLVIKFPPPAHPVNSVKAMRACLVLEEQGKLIPWARAVFQAPRRRPGHFLGRRADEPMRCGGCCPRLAPVRIAAASQGCPARQRR